MLQSRGELDLALKTLRTESRCQLRPKHLHGHRSLVFEVFGQVNRSHAAVPQLPREAVAISKRSGKVFEGKGHDNTGFGFGPVCETSADRISNAGHSCCAP